MKLKDRAKDLLNAAFAAQHVDGSFPMPRPLSSIQQCHGKAHKNPTLCFAQDGTFYFQCDDCLKEIIPSGFKTKKKKAGL